MIDLEYARNRIATELPRRVRWLIHGTSLAFNFVRAQRSLAPLHKSEINGDIDPEWASLHIFGEADFADGGGAAPFVGIDRNTGQVHGLDVERDSSCLFLYNSDLDRFIRTFTIFDDALRRGTLPLDSISSEASRIDVAFAQSDWARIIDYIVNDLR